MPRRAIKVHCNMKHSIKKILVVSALAIAWFTIGGLRAAQAATIHTRSNDTTSGYIVDHFSTGERWGWVGNGDFPGHTGGWYRIDAPNATSATGDSWVAEDGDLTLYVTFAGAPPTPAPTPTPTPTPAPSPTCAGVTPGSVTVTGSGGASYVVYGVANASYVFVQATGPITENYQATQVTGGDWSVTINPANYGTYSVNFYPGGVYCTSASFVRNAPSTPGTVIITSNNQSAANYLHWPDGTTHGWNGSHQWTGMQAGQYWLEADPVSGYTVAITPASTQTLASGGSLNFTITYTALPTVTANFTSCPTNIPYNSSVNVSWSSTNASSCTGAPAGGTGPSGNFNTGNLTSSQTYSVTCTR